MRDRSGLGNIYFEDVWINGTIPWISCLFYTTNVLISICNLALIPLLFYSIFIHWTYHRNLKIIVSNLYVAFFLVAFGNLIYSLLVLAQVSDKKYDNVFNVFRFGASIGPGIWRTTFVALVIERTAATILYKSYEKQAPVWLGIGLFFFAQTGIMIPILFFQVRLPYYVNTAILSIIDVCSALSIVILFAFNKSMRKITLNSNIKLSERYQIIENIRVVKLIAPLIILGTIFDFLASSLGAIQSLIDYNTQLLYPAYLFVNNLYVKIALYLSLRKDPKMKNKIIGVIRIVWKKKNMTISPNLNDNSVIRNVEGQILNVNETPEMRFRQLEEFWKK